MRANPDVTITTESEAREAIEQWKDYMPYRNWCAIELAGGWQVHDSVRSAKAAWRKAGKPQVKLLSFGRD